MLWRWPCQQQWQQLCLSLSATCSRLLHVLLTLPRGASNLICDQHAYILLMCHHALCRKSAGLRGSATPL
eukprot:14247-Heterococcus_DN1.PRE.2